MKTRIVLATFLLFAAVFAAGYWTDRLTRAPAIKYVITPSGPRATTMQNTPGHVPLARLAMADDVPVQTPPLPERRSFDDCAGSPNPGDGGRGCVTDSELQSQAFSLGVLAAHLRFGH